MELSDTLDRAAEGKLKRRADLAVEPWNFWEHRTLNIHRAVGLWRPSFSAPGSGRLDEQVRTVMETHFRSAWWRGFAFGVVIDVPQMPLAFDSFASLIDPQNRAKGTWQWTVVVSPKEKTAFGVHMWMEGYLSPVYRNVLAALEADGYDVSRLKAKKDRTMKLITSIINLEHTVKTLGMSRTVLEEFEDHR